MRKLFYCFFVVTICNLASFAQSVYGDVNGDGVVTSVDVTEVYNVLLGNYSAEMTVYTVNGVTFKMVTVDGGTFTMGASEDDTNAKEDEKPAHQVTLSAFKIGQTEVTQELWIAVMGSNPSYFTGNLQLPVDRVTWNDCQAFIAKLNQMTGMTFRLPTEAEWEFAARGGNKSHGYKFAGSDTIEDVAWYKANSGSKTHEVASKAPNELGLYDMTGNVWECINDWKGNYSDEPQTNPTGPDSGTGYVNRGGGWNDPYSNSTVTRRAMRAADSTWQNLGLRLAL